MKRGAVAWILALLFPLLLLALPAPLADTYSSIEGRFIAAGAFYVLLVSLYAGMRLGRCNSDLAGKILSAAAAIALSLLMLKIAGYTALPLKLLALLATAALVGMYFELEKHIRLQGLVSFTLFLLFIVAAEATLRALPETILARTVAHIPPLAPDDRGNELFTKNGFRGRQPLAHGEAQPFRIVTMGGSSTYGIPLPSAAQTFSDRLQAILNSQLLGTPYQVLNAGVPGYGIVQVLDSLEKYVVQFHPNMVIVNSWFNDSARGSGWYGYPGLSDREAQDRVELYREIEGSRVYRLISHLRLYGVFRHYLLELMRRDRAPREKKAARKQRRRMDAAEFKIELERFIELSKKYNFTPVFMYEVTNRQENLETALRKNPYLRAVSEVAAASGAALVDTITPFAERRGDWLFSDFIHPNRHGHNLLALTLYDTLFAKKPSKAGPKSYIIRRETTSAAMTP